MNDVWRLAGPLDELDRGHRESREARRIVGIVFAFFLVESAAIEKLGQVHENRAHALRLAPVLDRRKTKTRGERDGQALEVGQNTSRLGHPIAGQNDFDQLAQFVNGLEYRADNI